MIGVDKDLKLVECEGLVVLVDALGVAEGLWGKTAEVCVSVAGLHQLVEVGLFDIDELEKRWAEVNFVVEELREVDF